MIYLGFRAIVLIVSFALILIMSMLEVCISFNAGYKSISACLDHEVKLKYESPLNSDSFFSRVSVYDESNFEVTSFVERFSEGNFMRVNSRNNDYESKVFNLLEHHFYKGNGIHSWDEDAESIISDLMRLEDFEKIINALRKLIVSSEIDMLSKRNIKRLFLDLDLLDIKYSFHPLIF